MRRCAPASLQAAELPPALQKLLQQAQSLIPTSRNAASCPANPGSAPAGASRRQVLVTGVLLLLERAALLANQHRDLKLVRVSFESASATTAAIY